jgi:hypothetical protein
MKAAWKRWTGEATAGSDVHGLRLHSTVRDVPHFKTACRFLYCTLLKLCMLDLAAVLSVPLIFNASTSIQQIASLKDIMYMYVILL